MGSEGQLLSGDSALHVQPAAPRRPQALPRKGAPSCPFGAGSSRGSRLDHSGPAWHLPRLDRGGHSSPTDRASWDFCPCRYLPELLRDPLGSRSWEAPFPLDSSVILAPPSMGSRRITPHTNSSPFPPDRLNWISVERILQRGSSNQNLRDSPPPTVGFVLTKFLRMEAQAHLRTQFGFRGVGCQPDTPFTPIPEGPAHR